MFIMQIDNFVPNALFSFLHAAAAPIGFLREFPNSLLS